MRRSLAILTAALGAALASAGTAGAGTIHLSTEGGATLAGVSFTGGDVVEYDDVALSVTVPDAFDESSFNPPPSEEIDAFELLPSGNMILSTRTNAILNGYAFGNGDLVEYDPVNDIVTQTIFSEALFGPGGGNIDAVAVLPNGHILISTWDPETLPGVGSFRDGDVIEWDPIALTASPVLFFNEDWFGVDVNLDAFDVTSDGRIALSHHENADVTRGTLTFGNGDVVLYDINTDTATILFDESWFAGGNENIDAIAVPEPSGSALLGLGLVGLAFAGRRRPR